MRKQIVAGNWKMNLNHMSGIELLDNLVEGAEDLPGSVTLVVAPPFLLVQDTARELSDSTEIMTAGQDCHTEKSGAYTGCISAEMLRDAGAEWVIIGHSERREYCHETDEQIARKADAALEAGLEVIFCCGEALDIREAGTQNEFVAAQITAGLFHLDAAAMMHITIAYEPIWAIGTGKTATAAQAQEMHAHIRSIVEGKYGKALAQNVSILYGGSCKPSNAAEIFAGKDVDGGLIGGASLKADEFLAIAEALAASI